MRDLRALIASGLLAVVLGLVGIFGLRATLTPSAEQVATNVTKGDTAPPPLYGSR